MDANPHSISTAAKEELLHRRNCIYGKYTGKMAPILQKKMMRQNCSINLSGNEGKDIELDEFVESQMVGPLKQYYFRGTTVKTLELISANLQLFSSARKAYLSKSGLMFIAPRLIRKPIH